MYRINEITSVKRNNDISKSLKLFSLYNLSLLQNVQNLSFLNLLVDSMEGENILNGMSKVLMGNNIFSMISSPQMDSGMKISSTNSIDTDSHPKNTDNNSLEVSKNFNRKLKNIYSDPFNPLLRVVPSQTRISSNFGWRNDPFTGERTFHKGVDISAPKGTPIYPIKEGVVEEVGFSRSYGNYVRVRHDDETVSLYAHNEKNLIRKGEKVDTTTQIAKVGATGRATGSHLHFEILQNGKAINPQKYLDKIQYAHSEYSLETCG